MLPNQDIRDFHSSVEDAPLVRQLLCTYLPLPSMEKAAGFETSGFDCLVTVIRLIYATFATGIQGRDNMMAVQAQEAKNPILRYAWQSMKQTGLEPNEVMASWSREKKAVVSELLGGSQLSSEATSFSSLCGSKKMNETLWSLDSFWFYKNVIRFSNATNSWALIPWDTTQLAVKSQIEFDGNDILTLQDAVEKDLGVKKTAEGKDLYIAEPPCYVRIQYTPSSTKPLPFSELQFFSLPAGEIRQEGATVAYHGDLFRHNYCILAVVRLRRNPEKHDHVRGYWGNNIQKHIQPISGSVRYLKDDWSVEDPSHTYMLFYKYCPQESMLVGAELEPQQQAEEMDRADYLSELINEDLNNIKHARVQEEITRIHQESDVDFDKVRRDGAQYAMMHPPTSRSRK